MADNAMLQLLGDRDAFLAGLRTGHLPALDLSGANINFDFSGLTLNGANFSNCSLHGSRFSNSVLISCTFDGSDWKGCDFFNANFSNCHCREVRNAHKATGLDKIPEQSSAVYFESAQRPWSNSLLDWERIGLIGRLPLFGASSVALVLIPFYFYILDVYNRHVDAWKAALARHPETDAFTMIGKEALDRFGNLPIPGRSLEALISAVLLFVASVLYGFFCPPRIKQFSREQWCYAFDQKSTITYWPIAWKYPALRMICAAFYLIGGLLATWIISWKIYETAVYIWRNT